MNKEIASKILHVLETAQFDRFYNEPFCDYVTREIPTQSIPWDKQTEEILNQIERIFSGIDVV